MAATFFVLYNCLSRGFVDHPSEPLFLKLPEDKIVGCPELVGLETSAVTAQVQFFSSLSGVENSGKSKPLNEINEDRRIMFSNMGAVNERTLSINNQIEGEYQSNYRSQNTLVDSELFTGYPEAASIIPTYQRPVLNAILAKRNCHIIKCPKIIHASYGTDGTKCYEFSNPCFLAVASCQRHNNQMSRLVEVSKNHCDNLK